MYLFCRFGIVISGTIILSLLQAMRAFGQECFRDLQPASEEYRLHREFGPALMCLMAAAGLQLVSFIAHVIVPSPSPHRLDAHLVENTTPVFDTASLKVSSVVVERDCSETKVWYKVSAMVPEEEEDASVPRIVRELRRIDTGSCRGGYQGISTAPFSTKSTV